ncbi:MAG: hypothetical protein HY660_08930 [Armatimonadetes bacterium]|nr:hypothetical protein [Armatimonadota bacterium]
MKVSAKSNADLLALRQRECQGCLIGGMQVARRFGCDPEEYGYQMMVLQAISWHRWAGDLEKIAAIMVEHYQTFYGFADELEVCLEDGVLHMTMPSVVRTAEGQLTHWGASPEAYRGVQHGIWRAIAERAGFQVDLTLGGRFDTIRVGLPDGAHADP